jgi:hypothetical protein
MNRQASSQPNMERRPTPPGRTERRRGATRLLDRAGEPRAVLRTERDRAPEAISSNDFIRYFTSTGDVDVARCRRSWRSPDGRGVWPPCIHLANDDSQYAPRSELLDEPTRAEMRRVFSDPERKRRTSGIGSRTYLLTGGIARCGNCGARYLSPWAVLRVRDSHRQLLGTAENGALSSFVHL